MTPLRILLLAIDNNPDATSVPLVGYLHSKALAAEHQVTLVTHADNVAGIERRQAGFAQVVGISRGALDRLYQWSFRKLFKGNHGSATLTGFKLPFYLAFEYLVWRRFGAAIRKGEFDAVLRLTPVSSALPSYMAWAMRKLKTPFVIGPLNGGLGWPSGYSQSERESEFSQHLRDLYGVMPFSASTFKDAAAVICGSSQTWNEHGEVGDRRFFLPENGIEARHFKVRPSRPDGPLRLISVGRFVPCKAFDLGMRAAAPLLASGKVRLTMVGYGPEREALIALAAQLGVADAVTFTGELQHDQVIEAFYQHDVLLFPSIRDFGGGVVFEAMACGCVPAVTDYGGPGDIVTPDVGYRVPLSDEAGSERGFSELLQKLADAPAQLAPIAVNGQRMAREHYSWEGKAKQTASVLAWAAGKAARPALAPPPRAS